MTKLNTVREYMILGVDKFQRLLINEAWLGLI